MNPATAIASRPERKKRARVRGHGTVFRRGRMYWMELHWKGERVRKSLETDDRETALIKLDAEVAAIHSGAMPKTFEPITVQTMYEAWILLKETSCKASTVRDYKWRWLRNLKPAFGNLFATQVTTDKITEYLHHRMRDGIGVCARNRELTLLQMIFNYNRDKIPADRFPIFPKKLSERALIRKGRLSDSDFKKLQKRLSTPELFWLKVFLMMTFKYGFRKGELLNAQCGYFDRKAATFALPPFTTKNQHERVVDLVPHGEIHKMLMQLTEGRDSSAALFVRADGKPVRDFRAEWTKQVKGLKGGSGRHGVTIHDLRRAAITNMSEKGITAAQAGTHLTSDVFARYIVRSPEERRKTAALIEG